ncbi:MAG: hypothetical protein V1648_00780 [Candidatus Aenigmatarchaeota archaeon]
MDVFIHSNSDLKCLGKYTGYNAAFNYKPPFAKEINVEGRLLGAGRSYNPFRKYPALSVEMKDGGTRRFYAGRIKDSGLYYMSLWSGF